MKSKKIVLIILLILWMITVFVFSNESGVDSGNTSRGVVRAIVNILPGTGQMSEAEKDQLALDLHPWVRKLAHFTIYFIGGLIIALNVCLYTIDDEKRINISIIIGATYAVTDEIHQMFVGRESWRNN